MKLPKVTLDGEADVLHVRLAGRRVGRTLPLGDLRLLDYADDGSLVGAEFIGASSGIDLRDVPRSDELARAIGASGLAVSVLA